jgi:hypothetical protein
MSNSNASEKEEETGNHVVLFIYRLPKKIMKHWCNWENKLMRCSKR